MRLFLQKKLYNVSENYEPFKQKCLSFNINNLDSVLISCLNPDIFVVLGKPL